MVVARPYGVTADGHAVTEYTLENARGMQVKCLDLSLIHISEPTRR